MKSYGILYFLTNEAMPNLVKIGYTTGELKDRLQQLNTTGIPSPFQVVALFYVREPEVCESKIHIHLAKYRSNPKREFFSQSAAELIRESIDVLAQYMESSPTSNELKEPEEEFSPDNDDIYFMFFLLHDAYEKNKPLYTDELTEHHRKYAPLELGLKLMNLETHGYIKRVNREYEGLGRWQILPKGIKFMIEGNHHAQELIEEARGISRYNK
jgi:hypothetical protein